ncbi:GNAT family N-acetyltransferase [Limnohabitans radicicola]|uniref:GNAT family N-acetyltransferase n=1 Tax=Limnohabitans radicicola TaxID=2771427 RepID=A0A927FI63_9BURK|nr:GNAT family N-acetyltransferase [Limnohabitans radicicola]MBD8051048.1 GNAT family N-acetyltransferase [Limnohabitans radicicola]
MPPVSADLLFEPLSLAHMDELAALLLHEQVYRHIGGHPPDLARFRTQVEHAVAGPPHHRSNEIWLDYVVREAASGRLAGRIQATIHPPVAEVAFLFGPGYWGKGYATRALLWLHQALLIHPVRPELWATTVPANQPCQALLRRCGYVAVDSAAAPQLVTYDAGDLVFRGPSAA